MTCSLLFYFSNAIGPFVSIWLTAQTGEVENEALTPIWILLYGGIGIAIGLWIWGRRVIETVGSQLAKITPTRYKPLYSTLDQHVKITLDVCPLLLHIYYALSAKRISTREKCLTLCLSHGFTLRLVISSGDYLTRGYRS